MVYKNVEIPDCIIDDYVDKLSCSIEEACDCYLCDKGIIINQEQAQLDKATQGTTAQFVGAAGGSRPNRGKRSPNEDKKRIIRILFDSLWEISDEVVVTNDEKYINLHYNGADYVINLTKTRKKG